MQWRHVPGSFVRVLQGMPTNLLYNPAQPDVILTLTVKA